MECPECNTKLKRRRITRGNKTTERQNICPSCNQHYLSVEYFKADYDTLLEEHDKTLLAYAEKYNQLNDKYNKLVGALTVVSQAVEDGTTKE